MSPPELEDDAPLEQLLTDVFDLHRSGAYREAENLYRRLIDQYPTIWQLHFNYGLLLYELDRFEEALSACRRGLAVDSANSDLLYNQALCQMRLGAPRDAAASYHKVLALEPDDRDSMYNLAGCYRALGDDPRAIEWYEKTLGVEAEHLSALNNLAYLYHKNGKYGRAAELYRKILDLAPEHHLADHMLASIEGTKRETAPEDYVRKVFDQFSGHYDRSLNGVLNYRLPAALLRFMKHSFPPPYGRLLDLGCGTGLAGEVLRPYCETLDGVDISGKMVAVARKKSIYDALHVSAIQEFLSGCAPACYDCVVAADVLPYIGDVSTLFTRLVDIVSARGIFFFSVESSTEQKAGFQLQPSGRFAHSSTYIRERAGACGWKVRATERVDLRREKDAWVTGIIFALSSGESG